VESAGEGWREMDSVAAVLDCWSKANWTRPMPRSNALNSCSENSARNVKRTTSSIHPSGLRESLSLIIIIIRSTS